MFYNFVIYKYTDIDIYKYMYTDMSIARLPLAAI